MSSINLVTLLILSFVVLSSASYNYQLSLYWQTNGHLNANSSCAHRWVPARPSYYGPHVAHPHNYPFEPKLVANTTPAPTRPPPGPPKFCMVKNFTFRHLNITEWNLIPLTLGGVAIGAGGFVYLTSPSAVALRSRVSYAVIFGFFFIMNFSALIAHCFSASISSMTVNKLMFFLDGVGTSGVCLSLLIAALTDLNVFSDTGRVKLILSGLLYAGYVYGWYATAFGGWPLGFPLLYLLTTVVGSVSYFVLQFVWLVKNGFSQKAVFLLASFLVGMVGLETILNQKWAGFLCDHLPHWLAGETPWFLASDLSLYLLFLYVTKREGSLYAKLKAMVSVEEGLKSEEQK